MPRIPRGQVGGYPYHVLNRGSGDTATFGRPRLLLAPRCRQDQFLVKVFGVCLMPNHFHLLAQPATETTLRKKRGQATFSRTALKALEKVACPLFFLRLWLEILLLRIRTAKAGCIACIPFAIIPGDFGVGTHRSRARGLLFFIEPVRGDLLRCFS